MRQHYLRISSPSPTTISYTVSTRPPNPSTRAKLFTLLKHLIRLTLATFCLLVNLSKARLHLEDSWLEWTADFCPECSLVQRVADGYDWWILAAVSVVVVYACVRRDYTEETLLTLSNLGIQTLTTSPYFLPLHTTTFIPTNEIRDIVIHEAFHGLEVRFYLAVVVRGGREVVVVFPKLLPNLEILEEVWRGARRCLYESGS